MADVKLFIVGAGMKYPSQITAEGLRMLNDSHEVWTVMPESWMGDHRTILGVNVQSFFDLYRPGVDRETNYQAAVEHLFERARLVGNISYLCPGNPFVFDSVATGLANRARKLGWELEVASAPSSIDGLLCALRHDLAYGGQIYEATTFMDLQPRIDRRFPLYLLQIDVLRLRTPAFDLQSIPPLDPLLPRLIDIYGESATCALVKLATNINQRDIVTNLPVAQLVSVPKLDYAGASLVVRPT